MQHTPATLSKTAFEKRGELSILIRKQNKEDHVRRIYSAKGKADRALEQLAQFGDRDAALGALQRLAARLGCEFEQVGNRAYAWRERRSETEYPTREELFSIAPATVQTKAHFGLDWFENRWAGGMQMRLFQALSR